MSDLKCAGCAVSVTLINDLTREKSAATCDLICAHREIERHKSTIGHLDAEVAKLREENDETLRALDELLAQVRVGSAVTDWSDTLNNVMRRRYARECEQWKANHEQRKMERDEARARLALVEPVYEAAKVVAAKRLSCDCADCAAARAALRQAVVDAELAAEKERTDGK